MKVTKEAVTSGELSLSIEQVKKLLSVIDNIEDEVLLRLALDLGARRSDIIEIRINNIDLEKGFIYYYQNKKDKWITRIVSERTITTIKKYLNTRTEKYNRYLFPARQKNNLTKHLSSKSAYNILRKYMLKAGLITKKETIRFHALRSTCIKLKQSAGWSLEVTAYHVDDKLETVRKHYTTPTKEELKRLSRENPALNF